ncbi:MAG: hypothetical protein FWF59_00420 [Turicibacter sp.]|nr:hypothetical protein [Turicibacter sp.]
MGKEVIETLLKTLYNQALKIEDMEEMREAIAVMMDDDVVKSIQKKNEERMAKKQ